METGKPVLYLKKYKVALNYTGSNLILGTFLIPWRQFLGEMMQQPCLKQFYNSQDLHLEPGQLSS